MMWVWIFLGIAFAGLVMTVFFVIWLAHKAGDLFSEFKMIGGHVSDFLETLGTLRPRAEQE
ncbi:MAG: hypothetical protein LBR20_09155 [Propionibacteriaceae bacterium]|jgi:hypothetical protein|nr:hypothetical protein [Propionibacteriaceae bacterium]